jgi:hypothetical protein
VKSKYTGLVGLVIAGAALLVIGTQFMLTGWNQPRSRASQTVLEAYSSTELMVDPDAVARMDLVEPTLPKLVKLEKVADKKTLEEVSSVDYAMFGQRPPPVKAVAGKPVAERRDPFPYTVVMTYVSGDHRYAVLNKKLYREGAVLPDGESLAEVTPSAVRVTDSGNEPRWIPVHSDKQAEPEKKVTGGLHKK